MSLSLPGNYLYYLPKDDLEPEEYERIISPFSAWSRICEKYEFDDSGRGGFYIVNIQERPYYRSSHQPAPQGPREKARLKSRVESGDVVMLSDMYGPGSLFYISDEGKLICTDYSAFHRYGTEKILHEYDLSVGRRDYRSRGGKLRPTVRQVKKRGAEPQPETYGTINSKMAGRLLAAGGVYNQNPEMFADTARNLGGEAAEGFDQVLNEKTAGSLVALSSLLMVGKASAIGRSGVTDLKKLETYLGTYKGSPKLLKNIDVIEMKYIKRSPEERLLLRRKFESVRKEFLKQVAKHPDVKKRLSSEDLEKMALGRNPVGWEVHHKLPLDDSGTNDLKNLVLIQKKPEHAVFTTTQQRITRNIDAGGSDMILWPMPKGVIYP